jgi:hypothetical protein
MNAKSWFLKIRGIAALTAAVAAVMLAMGASMALADEPIVGLWLATWIDDSAGPGRGNVVAKVWDVWHADHTETQNDSGPVVAGFVCQGAWKALGNRTYFLSHPSFNYLGPDGHLDATSVSVIYEKVTVSKDGNYFEGKGVARTVTGLDPFDPSATLIGSLPVRIKAKRVVPDPSQLP